MNVIRVIKEVVECKISIDMPEDLLHRKVEVIVIPLDEISSEDEHRERKAWPPGFFEKTAGCLAADPVQRTPQGDYEHREHVL